MDKIKIERINQLARLAKERELTPEEAQERQALRQEYLASVRQNMRSTLDSMLVENEKGEYEPLKKRTAEQIARDKHEHHHHHGKNCTCGCGDHHHDHKHKH